MRAVILAGGEGTRLRPLTLTTPKPVVPVVDRPFLRHQLDLLARAGVREVVFSVAYRPERVEAVFGDGGAPRRHDPLRGRGDAARHGRRRAQRARPARRAHDRLERRRADRRRPRRARGGATRPSGPSATIVLTPGRRTRPPTASWRPTPSGRVLRFLEKPKPDEITTDTINAGIYVLETRVLDLIPPGRQPLDRARLLPRPARPRRPRARARAPRLLDRHRHPREVPAGPPRHPPRPLPRRARGRARRAAASSAGRAGRPRGASSSRPSTSDPAARSRRAPRLGPDAVLVADVRVEPGRARARQRAVGRGRGGRPTPSCETRLLGPGVQRRQRTPLVRGAAPGRGQRRVRLLEDPWDGPQ